MDRREAVYHGTELISETFRDVSWERIRSERKQWFAITDLWYLKDRWDNLSSSHKGILNSFRQTLRDLPQNHTTANQACDAFPEAEEWF